jgi:hypothetical protein
VSVESHSTPSGTYDCQAPDVGWDCEGGYNLDRFQPADRYWSFQIIETGLFQALPALLLAVTVHHIRRRKG